MGRGGICFEELHCGVPGWKRRAPDEVKTLCRGNMRLVIGLGPVGDAEPRDRRAGTIVVASYAP